jgi:hypothetical protein
MKIKLKPISCREVTRIVLQGEDRAITLRERVVLRLHYFICDRCVRFRQQAKLMRKAIDRWRAYRDSGA